MREDVAEPGDEEVEDEERLGVGAVLRRSSRPNLPIFRENALLDYLDLEAI